MPSSTHYVYRELEEMIAKNRKAIGASCDFSQSRWVCGTKKGGVKEGPIYEGAFTMATLADNLPKELLDHNYASTDEPPEIIEIGKKTVPLLNNVQNHFSPARKMLNSFEDDVQWVGKSSCLLRRNYDGMCSSPPQKITAERSQSRSPARQQRNRSSKRSNGGQHKLDAFLRKKSQDENLSSSRKRQSIQEQFDVQCGTVTKPDSMLSVATAAAARKTALIFAGYPYSFLGVVGVVIFISLYWDKMRMGWKQILPLTLFAALEFFLCPYFKGLVHVTVPLGHYKEGYGFTYCFLALIWFVAALNFLFGFLDSHCRKMKTIPLCVVVGAYYIGYYLEYSLQNGLLILVDWTNLFSFMESGMKIVGDFLGNAVKAKVESDMAF